MNPDEMRSYVGQTLIIRGTKHICIAASDTALLIMEFNAKDEPVQYIVAHHPRLYEGELVWAQGSYYSFHFRYFPPNAIGGALEGAAMELNETVVYTAMADDDLGARCIGVFTNESLAVQALESILNKSDDALELCHEQGQSRLTLDEYNTLRDERLLENAYWIEEHEPNNTNS